MAQKHYCQWCRYYGTLVLGTKREIVRHAGQHGAGDPEDIALPEEPLEVWGKVQIEGYAYSRHYHVHIGSERCWGNFGERDIARHIDRLRKRARRAIFRAEGGKFPLRLEIEKVHSYGDGVIYAVEFKEVR